MQELRGYLFFFNPKDADNPLLFSLSSFLAVYVSQHLSLHFSLVFLVFYRLRKTAVCFTAVMKQAA